MYRLFIKIQNSLSAFGRTHQLKHNSNTYIIHYKHVYNMKTTVCVCVRVCTRVYYSRSYI